MMQQAGSPDLAQLQATMQSIELACSSIQPELLITYIRLQIAMTSEMHINPAAAEATILSLSQTPQPYKACQFILENSALANARFQAASAIKDAAIREWSLLASDDKKNLINFCLNFAMQHATSPEGYVQAKVSSVAALLMKRGWLDFTASDKEAMFYQILLRFMSGNSSSCPLLKIDEENTKAIRISQLVLNSKRLPSTSIVVLILKPIGLPGQNVHQAVIGMHGLEVQFTGINFLESFVSEFSPSTSSAMGLPREFHEQCRMSLELDYLKSFYCWARDAASSATNKIIESTAPVPEVKVCNAALRLMLQILNWEFRYRNGGAKAKVNVFSPGVRPDNLSSKRADCPLVQAVPLDNDYDKVPLDVEIPLELMVVLPADTFPIFFKPGPAWRDVLVSSGHVGWLLSFYAALREKFSSEGYWLDCPIAVSARKLIVQFCSLTGTIFSGNEQMQQHHLLQLLASVVQWIDPPDVVSNAIQNGKSESEMLDGCRALLSMATVTTPSDFDQLLKSIRPFGTLTLLSTLMCEVLKVLMTNDTDEETWSWEARDILLDTWSTLLVAVDSNFGNTMLPPEGINAAASLFTLIVESELKVASASAKNDDDSDYLQASISAMDERLSSYALIARAAIDVTVPFLTHLFTERFARLHQGRGGTDPTETLEELYSLLLITGHVLAEDGEGETALIPDAFQTHFIDAVEAERHPAVMLPSTIIKFAEQCLDPRMREYVFSPRLMEAVVWFLARWANTYLLHVKDMNEDNSYSYHGYGNHVPAQQAREVLLSFFDVHNQGKFILDIIVRISMTALIQYPGEKDLQELTCCHLLHALVRRKSICVHLVALDSWRDLANAFANEKTLFYLNSSNQRSLAQTLVLSASGLRNSAESNQYVRNLMGPMTAYLVELSNKPDLKSVAQQPDIIQSVSCLLDRLRGAASANEPCMQVAIYEMWFSVTKPVLILLEVYKHESAVVYLLLKFVVDWVEGQLTYLVAQETAVVIDFCKHLFQLYSSQNMGKISVSLSSTLLREAKTDQYKDLRALLQLLSSMCSKDMVDLSSDSSEELSANISQVNHPYLNIVFEALSIVSDASVLQVVYFGLLIVTPLISLELLKYPKLCRDYFALLTHALEVYPEAIAQLNSEAFSHVLRTLEFGMRHQDTDIVTNCLRALKALASYHYKETTTGKIGLGMHASSLKDPNGNLQAGILSEFLRSLLQLLLFEDYSPDLIRTAADALLPLILCDQALYQKLAAEVIERQGNPSLKIRLANAFQLLTTANQLSCTLDRINCQRFARNLSNFLIEVRGFLKTDEVKVKLPTATGDIGSGTCSSYEIINFSSCKNCRLAVAFMGTELMRVHVKEENDETPSVPPGFESFASFSLTRVQDSEMKTSCSASTTQSVETKAEPSKMTTRPLRRKPGVNYGNLLDDSSEDESDEKHDIKNLRPPLPQGVIRGCLECKNCQKVTARWRPKDACKPIIEDSPVFYPNEEEFEDTLKYIASIRPNAEPYGICRIVPPSSWKPPCPLKDNKTIWENSKFLTRVQRVDKLQNRDSVKKMSKVHNSMRKKRRCMRMAVDCGTDGGIVANNEFGFEPGPEFTLNSFQKYADEFKAQYFSKTDNWEPSTENIEGEYWRIVEKATEQIEVLYGADLETGAFGSGFPKSSQVNSTSDEKYLKSGWNLNNFPKLPGSVLSYESGEISGVLVPWLYIGMCFSSFCWHVEDHHLYSLNYMHWGAPKLWYGVSEKYAVKLEEAMRKHLPELFEEQPDLLHKLVTQLSPSILKSEGVPVYRCVQNAGEFVLTFPRAYHSGFNSGFNCAEAVNVAPIDWLPHGQTAIELYREQARKTSISHDKLLLGAAREAVKACWELNFLKKNTPDNLRWRDFCGKDGFLAKALKMRVEMENNNRQFICHGSQGVKMDKNFDATCERECSVCFFDLHLSAAGCHCSPEKYSCLNHATQLCSCSSDTKYFLFRYDISELNVLVEALQGKLSAVYRWAKSDLGLSLTAYVQKDKSCNSAEKAVNKETKPQPNSAKSLVGKEVSGSISKSLKTFNESNSQESWKLSEGTSSIKQSTEMKKEENLKIPVCQLSATAVELRAKNDSVAGQDNNIIILTDDDEDIEPKNTVSEMAKEVSVIKLPDHSKRLADFDNITSLSNHTMETTTLTAPATDALVLPQKDVNSLPEGQKKNLASNFFQVKEKPDLSSCVASGSKANVNNSSLKLNSSVPSNIRPKGPRIATAVRRINCNVEPLEHGVVLSGKSWCNSLAIFPKGFRSRVRYVSVIDPSTMCYYISEILDGGHGGPLFKVSMEDCPSEVFIHLSATRCWEMPVGSLDGLEFFGFSSPQIVQVIEAMDRNRVCTEYWDSRPYSRPQIQIPHPQLKDNGGSGHILASEKINADVCGTPVLPENVDTILEGLFKKANPEELHSLRSVLSEKRTPASENLVAQLLIQEISNRGK
ncbi:hypothetical protein ACFE04_022169 [Oxalis oulophora]